MKRRGPKSLLTPQLQKRICDLLAAANTIKTACDACGIGERTFYDWMERYPAFAAAVHRARAKAKMKLVRVIIDQAPDDWGAAAWALERSYPKEYARVTVERVEPFEEKKESKPLTILYQTGNHTIAELLDFPNVETDSPEAGREKQRRLLGQTAKTPAQPEPEKISDAPAPSVVNKAFTGRIRPEWKGNCK